MSRRHNVKSFFFCLISNWKIYAQKSLTYVYFKNFISYQPISTWVFNRYFHKNKYWKKVQPLISGHLCSYYYYIFFRFYVHNERIYHGYNDRGKCIEDVRNLYSKVGFYRFGLCGPRSKLLFSFCDPQMPRDGLNKNIRETCNLYEIPTGFLLIRYEKFPD